MSYRVYISEAIVCGSEESFGADKSYLLLVRELGMLYAVAKSVREERSKQRFALQEFSRVRVNLISGRRGWKIAGVEALENYYAVAKDREMRKTVRQTVLLLRRVMKGSEPSTQIFDDIVAGFGLLSQENASDVDILLSLRILDSLGYIAPQKEIDEFLTFQNWENAPLPLVESRKTIARSCIETALEVSQL